MKINHASVGASGWWIYPLLQCHQRQRIFPLGYRSNDNNNKVANQRIGQSDTIARFMEIGLTVVARISRINVIPIPNSRICISFRPSRSIKIYSGICVPSERLSRGEKQAKVSKLVRFGSNSFEFAQR